MNLLELKNWVYRFLQATPDNGNWPEAEVEQYLRDEELKMFMHIVAKDEDFFYTVGTPISEVALQATYPLPTNLYKLLRLERVSGGATSLTNPVALAAVDKNFSQEQRARGTGWPTAAPGLAYLPMAYILHGQNSFELVPTPASAYASSLRPIYAARPAGMVLPTDVPFQITSGPGGSGTDDLREFHDLISLGACRSCLEHEEAYPQADRIERRYEERLFDLRQYLAQINVQQPRFVHVTDQSLYS